MANGACPKCKKVINLEATVCPFCQSVFSEDEMEARRSEHKAGKKSLGIGCLVLILIVLALAMCTGSGDETAPASTPASTATTTDAAAPEAAPDDGLTAPQKNARRSAENYIAMTGFSRQGLIEQLSSDAGDGYDKADATAAVDSMTIDWNEQAARSAENYLDMTGFSCNGLVDQLSSDAGDGYTKDQAKFGAKQAGAC